MAIVFLGMAEVSSCDLSKSSGPIKEGDSITKGERIGMFHFGGSSHCLVFRKQTALTAQNLVNPPPWKEDVPNNAVCSALAVLTAQMEHEKHEPSREHYGLHTHQGHAASHGHQASV
jgi:hypothetical protein